MNGSYKTVYEKSQENKVMINNFQLTDTNINRTLLKNNTDLLIAHIGTNDLNSGIQKMQRKLLK